MTGSFETFRDDILRASGAYGCVECGKCVAVCPMQEMYPGFSVEMSPRGMIKKSLFERNILGDENLWYCTECNACTDICPEGVSCRDLIKAFRKMALGKGLVKDANLCKCCRAPFGSVPILNYVRGRLKEKLSAYLDLCPSCRREVYFRRNT